MEAVKIINDWGQLYRMSERDFKRYLEAGTRGEDPEPADYGKPAGEIALNTKDIQVMDFQDALNALLKEKS